MSEDEDTRQHPHNPYAPAPGDPIPNQYGQFTGKTVADNQAETTAAGTASDKAESATGGVTPNNVDNANQEMNATDSTVQTASGAGEASQGDAYTAYANPATQGNPAAYENIPATPPTLKPGEVRVTHLGVRMMTPTHFDNQVLVSPPPPEVEEIPPTKEEERRSLVRLAMTVIPSVIALVCLVFGIWAMFSMMTKDGELQLAQKNLADKTAIIEAIEQQTGTTVTDASNVSAVVAVDGYIYIPGWRVKLKIPTALAEVSYILNQTGRQMICFNAMQAGETVPAYADIWQNRGGVGCLVRLPAEVGEVDETTGAKYGELTYSANGYNYFYVAPGGYFSADEATQREEGVVVRLIKEMVSGGNIGSY